MLSCRGHWLLMHDAPDNADASNDACDDDFRSRAVGEAFGYEVAAADFQHAADYGLNCIIHVFPLVKNRAPFQPIGQSAAKLFQHLRQRPRAWRKMNPVSFRLQRAWL